MMVSDTSYEIRFDTNLGEVILSPYDEEDADAQVSYLYDSPPDFLKKIGFDLNKILSRDDYRRILHEGMAADRTRGLFRQVGAKLGLRTIAGVLLPLRELPDVPRAHFHIFDSTLRDQGLGLKIIRGGLKLLMAKHQLTKVYVEPKFDNHPMNRLMVKTGFPYIGECTYSGPSTETFRAKRYEVTSAALSSIP